MSNLSVALRSYIGKRYHRLTVVSVTYSDKDKRWRLLCSCDCGGKKEARRDFLEKEKIRSCGCMAKEQKERGCYKKYIGEKFNKLHITEISDDVIRYPNGEWKRRKCTCVCECGVIKDYDLQDVKDNRAKSCGCVRKINLPLASRTHGMSESIEYHTWLSMKKRCTNVTHRGYKYYGGRGIKVCDEWMHSFETFYEHMGPKPMPHDSYSIDRINVHGNYSPGNVRWATIWQQANNKQRHAINS